MSELSERLSVGPRPVCRDYQKDPIPGQETLIRENPAAWFNSGGQCPRGTPGCNRTDCSPAPGHSCYGPSAPRHIDMGD